MNKGDALIDIDSRTYRANLLQAQGAVERDPESSRPGADGFGALSRRIGAQMRLPSKLWMSQEKLVLQDEGTVSTDQGVV